jgi:hypothetical protein
VAADFDRIMEVKMSDVEVVAESAACNLEMSTIRVGQGCLIFFRA